MRPEIIINNPLQRDDNSVGFWSPLASCTIFLPNTDLAGWNSSIARPVKNKLNHQYWLILPTVVCLSPQYCVSLCND